MDKHRTSRGGRGVYVFSIECSVKNVLGIEWVFYRMCSLYIEKGRMAFELGEKVYLQITHMIVCVLFVCVCVVSILPPTHTSVWIHKFVYTQVFTLQHLFL